MDEGDASYARQRAARYRRLAGKSDGGANRQSLEELAGKLDKHADAQGEEEPGDDPPDVREP